MQTAIEALPQECNFNFDIHEEKIPLFEGRFGYTIAWKAKRVSVVASEASEAVSGSCSSPSVRILSATEIPLVGIVGYDAPFHTHDRSSFLARWLAAPNCHSYAATTSHSGSVVGHAVVRRTLRHEDGWRLSPLYADNVEVGKCLYHAIFDEVASKDPSALITFDVPCISEAMQTAFELTAKIDEHIARGYRYCVPSNLPLSNMFVL